MINSKYADAYKEVLNVISKLNKDDFDKIPKEYIEFFEANCNNEYKFIYDNSKSFDEQELLDDTKYILFCLFEKFGATDIQKSKIKSYKINYNTKLEKQKKEKYNTNDIFKRKEKKLHIEHMEDMPKQVSIIEYKEFVIKKIFDKIKSIFKRKGF